MLVYEKGQIVSTIGGGKIEALVIKTALSCIKKGESGKFVFDLTPKGIGMICAGKMEVFIDVYKAPLKVFICGAGHVAKQLGRVLAIAGLPYSVADERKEFACLGNFPDAFKIIVDYPDKALKKAKIDRDTYVVIMTRGHQLDKECLLEAVKTKAAYIGMIGSASKVRVVMSSLRKKGVKIDNRVYSPIGLDLGGKTPGEIAVSVVAEILKLYYGRSGVHMNVNMAA